MTRIDEIGPDARILLSAKSHTVRSLKNSRQRWGLAAAAACSAWIGEMLLLRIAHPWAFQTEFRSWAVLTGLFAVSLMIVIATWIGSFAARNRRTMIVRSMLSFAAAATILPLGLFPLTGGGSVVLLITGHAYFMAAVAAAVYVLARLRLRE